MNEEELMIQVLGAGIVMRKRHWWSMYRVYHLDIKTHEEIGDVCDDPGSSCLGRAVESDIPLARGWNPRRLLRKSANILVRRFEDRMQRARSEALGG